MLNLTTSVQYVRGIGPHFAEILLEKGISTVEDLLYYLPFRYEDRLNPRGIGELRTGEMASIIADVRTFGLFRTRRMPIFEMTVGQGRDTLKCIWFNATYLRDKFRAGMLIALYGKVEAGDRGGHRFQIIQPQFEILHDPSDPEAGKEEQSLEVGRIVPIYESAGNGRLTARWFRRVIHGMLENLGPEIPDAIPAIVRGRMNLIDRRPAFWQAHWPEPGESLTQLMAARTPAHIRLIFEELFFLELGLELKRRKVRAQSGVAFPVTDRVRDAIKRILPFHPTAAQKRVLKEIADDMTAPVPMRRLLQGDVGSGKTILAFEAAVIAIENGYQVALMAPTEILATQHYLSARQILEAAGYRIVLLTGSQETGRKKQLRRHIAQGNAQLVIGTHALIQESVEFDKLGLVIVDEQHRFGVMQRFKLMKKADAAPAGDQSPIAASGVTASVAGDGRQPKSATLEPDVLVMTATPIPRTLALTIYGDLDTSILDELPPGRTPITTRRVGDERADEVWQFVRKQVAAGHQAYIVYPVIEEGAMEGELKAAIKMHEHLRSHEFSSLHVGLLHGRMSADDKDATMAAFKRGEIQVLVSTTVIEVGVDVPNANVMVIEHAERFGLSQLHQLRGRIGRGAAKSYCVLMTGGKVSEEAQQRLDAMVRTQNGFEIAEIDLQQRGPGEFFGTRQAGIPNFRVANLLRDRDLLEAARKEAGYVLSGNKADVTKEELGRAVKHLRTRWNRRYGLVEVG
ncbi:MAG TPA: ATP-dependent DNA helicase RecG [Terriglobales bacterium]|nr:ATP-dependent DNA helicase RecG [Terriglobales bacterium]